MSDKAKKIILIVEDEHPLSEAISEYLEHAGYVAKTAFSGMEALKVLGTLTPDLILLDIVLPEMNGVTFLKTIQQGSPAPFKNIPVIVFSNLVGEKAWIEEMGLHVADYLVKANSSLAEVAARVKKILE
ncbi:MAG: response regulator [Candidatus Harrisonbacteria bacterium]|nr:response regulator [Candidatus Harrisonbacteria bacterium]